MNLALAGESLKKSMKFFKKPRYSDIFHLATSLRNWTSNIKQFLTIYIRLRIPKEARYLGSTWINSKKLNGPSFHLWMTAETNDYGRWKVDHVRQYCAKKIVVEARRSFTNGYKARIDAKEVDAECLVGLERKSSSWPARNWLNCQFDSLLSTINAIEAGDEKKNSQKLAIGKALSSITTTLDHTYVQCILHSPLMHPPYSPDLAPSDCHLKNSLNDVKLASKEACENHLVQFFA